MGSAYANGDGDLQKVASVQVDVQADSAAGYIVVERDVSPVAADELPDQGRLAGLTWACDHDHRRVLQGVGDALRREARYQVRFRGGHFGF